MATLIQTAKMNDVDPQTWLADVLARIADTPQNRLAELLPWNWPRPNVTLNAALTGRFRSICRPISLVASLASAHAKSDFRCHMAVATGCITAHPVPIRAACPKPGISSIPNCL